MDRSFLEKSPYERMFDRNYNWTWQQVVDWYESELNQLVVDDDIDHNGVKRLDKAIDDLYRVHRKDFARVIERMEKVDRYIKRITVKAAANVPGRTNENTRKSAGIQAAETAVLDKGQPPVNLYDLEDQYIAYYEYMKYVTDVLERKTGALMRALGSNKIESWISGKG